MPVSFASAGNRSGVLETQRGELADSGAPPAWPCHCLSFSWTNKLQQILTRLEVIIHFCSNGLHLCVYGKIFSVAFMNNFFVYFSPLCVIWQIYKFNYWGRSSNDDLLDCRARFRKCMQIYAERDFANTRLAPASRHSQTAPLSINYLNFIVLH